MDLLYKAEGLEPEVLAALPQALHFAQNLRRADNALKALRRALGSRTEELNIVYRVSSMFSSAPSITIQVPGVQHKGFSYLHSIPKECDPELAEAYQQHNAELSWKNLQIAESIYGILHRTFCCNWVITTTTEYNTYFRTTFCDSVDLTLRIVGPLAEAYKEVAHSEAASWTPTTETVPVCELGFNEASIGG